MSKYTVTYTETYPTANGGLADRGNEISVEATDPFDAFGEACVALDRVLTPKGHMFTIGDVLQEGHVIPLTITMKTV